MSGANAYRETAPVHPLVRVGIDETAPPPRTNVDQRSTLPTQQTIIFVRAPISTRAVNRSDRSDRTNDLTNRAIRPRTNPDRGPRPRKIEPIELTTWPTKTFVRAPISTRDVSRSDRSDRTHGLAQRANSSAHQSRPSCSTDAIRPRRKNDSPTQVPRPSTHQQAQPAPRTSRFSRWRPKSIAVRTDLIPHSAAIGCYPRRLHSRL